MATLRHSPDSRFATAPAPSLFNQRVRSGIAYDYWAPSSQPATGRRRGRRSAPLAGDILAPLGEPPRYYALAWQLLLWLTFAVLVLMVMFG